MQEAFGERSAAVRFWTALNSSPSLTFVCLIALYALIACMQAATRLLWVDELITLAVARTGSFAAIWHALSRGADPNPPLIHDAVLLSIRIFGESALAVRLPAVVSMLLATVCVWVLLRRWVAPGFAAVGVLAFMATRGFDYSYEARSYAPLAGFTMGAVVCWLWAADRVPGRGAGKDGGAGWSGYKVSRGVWLVGMAACLALALSSNYYGVMAWFPIAAGEVVLSVKRRRVDAGTWVCLAVAALPLWAYLPLIRQDVAEFMPHAWNRPQASMVGESYLILVEGVFWPVVLGGAALWWRRSRGPRAVGSGEGGRPVDAHEAAMLAVLLGYPLLGFGLAVAMGGMISPRCVIPVCCGFGISAGLIAARLVPSRRQAVIVLGTMVVWVVVRESACAVLLQKQRAHFMALMERVVKAPPGPVYVSDSALVLPLAHYGGDELRGRLVFPVDFAAIHTWETDDSGEQNLWAGRDGVFPIRIVPYSVALAQGRPALVIARPGGWLPRKLAGDGVALKDATTAEDLELLGSLGGVFTPMDHEDTRLLVPTR